MIIQAATQLKATPVTCGGLVGFTTLCMNGSQAPQSVRDQAVFSGLDVQRESTIEHRLGGR